jgi:hypothetical protein
MANNKFMGYRRENGRVGIRNHVIILPLDIWRGPGSAFPHPDRHGM